MSKDKYTSASAKTWLPESLKYLSADQAAAVHEFWTLQAVLGVRQRWNVGGMLLMVCAPFLNSIVTPEFGDNATLVKNIALATSTLGSLIGGISVVLNRAKSSRLEQIVLSMGMRVGSNEKVIGIGRAIKQIEFVPFGSWIYRRFGQD